MWKTEELRGYYGGPKYGLRGLGFDMKKHGPRSQTYKQCLASHDGLNELGLRAHERMR